jgi:hypothetical protein
MSAITLPYLLFYFLYLHLTIFISFSVSSSISLSSSPLFYYSFPFLMSVLECISNTLRKLNMLVTALHYRSDTDSEWQITSLSIDNYLILVFQKYSKVSENSLLSIYPCNLLFCQLQNNLKNFEVERSVNYSNYISYACSPNVVVN